MTGDYKNSFLIFAILTSLVSFSQDSAKKINDIITLSGFVESYYCYDFNQPDNSNRPAFFYSYNRHNEVNINLAYLKLNYNSPRSRGNIAIATGSYMNANYISEPGVLKNLYEANTGVRISKRRNLWVDIGVFPSHIGFETAHSPDCWILTRSIIADNSPYFESGAKITFISPKENWLISILALNGWQRIHKLPGNSLLSWGAQIQYKPFVNTLINHSSFVGTDTPDSSRRWRFFHNLYGIIEGKKRVSLILDIDFGQQQKTGSPDDYSFWWGMALIGRLKLENNWTLALRTEYYKDSDGVIIPGINGKSFKTFGSSINLDKKIGEHFLWRAELRTLNSPNKIYSRSDNFVNNNTAATTSFSLSF